MLAQKRPFAVIVLLITLLLAACQNQGDRPTAEVTRVLTDTIVIEGEIIEVTRIFVETVIVDDNAPGVGRKHLTICMNQEPDSLYPYGATTQASQAVRAAIFETDITTLGYDFQALGIETLPSLDNGLAVIKPVTVAGGDIVVDATGNIITLATGTALRTHTGDLVTFDGEPVQLSQMTVDFTLQPRVWADGTMVTAADSVYSFQLNLDPDTPGPKTRASYTASYEATGERSLRWTGLPGHLDNTYFRNIWQPLPTHLWDDMSAADLVTARVSNRKPVGDGPFRLMEWQEGEQIRLEANPHFWREGYPFLDTVTFRFVPDPEALVSMLLQGECHMTTRDSLDPAQASFLLTTAGNDLLTAHFQPGVVYEHIDFGINSFGDYGDDVGRPDWFEDARVRQAITQCTDRQSMVDDILFGQPQMMHGYLPNFHPLYADDIAIWPYDVSAANALLDAAGFLDKDNDGLREYPGADNGRFANEPFTISLLTTTGNDMRRQIAQRFQANMRDCGIQVELIFQPANKLFADGADGRIFGRQFDLALFAWTSEVVPNCRLFLSSNVTGPEAEGLGGWDNVNNTGWQNEAFDAACQQARAALPGTAVYTDAHKEAQRIFAEELPIMPLFPRLIIAATRPEVTGFALDATSQTEMVNLYQFDLEFNE